MAGLWQAVVLLAGLRLAVYIWRVIGRHAQKQRAQAKYGCEDAVKYPHTDRIRGSDLTALRKQALREGRLVKLYVDQHRALGETWQEEVDGKVVINTISGLNFQYMYALHMSKFHRDISAGSFYLFGKAVFLVDGEEWKWSRKRVEPTFSKYETSTMPMLKVHVDRFMSELPGDAITLDIQPLIKRLFLDLTTEFLFGQPIGMQIPQKRREAEEFLQTLDAALLGMNQRRQGFTQTSIKLYFDRSYSNNVKRVHAFVDARVEAALIRTQSVVASTGGSKHTYRSPTAAGRYILVDELAKQVRDPIYLRHCMIQCFLPGRDNTAILLSNTLFGLARHSEYWARLRPIALELTDDESLTFMKLATLQPIRNAIFESLRLFGPGGGNRRRAAEDIIFPVGGGPKGDSPLFVPKGTVVQTFLPAMHRNIKCWGEDVDKWRPERFERHGGGWEFKPFLAGPRTCPAKDQVVVQITYILVRMLRQFKSIENRDEVEEFVEMARMTTESRRGVRIGLISHES